MSEFERVGIKNIGCQTDAQLTNSEGFDSINSNETLFMLLQAEECGDQKERDQFAQAAINSKFAIAKAYSMLFSADGHTKLEYLKKSLEGYIFIKNYISSKGAEKGSLNFSFAEQLKLSEEMCQLLPIKINKIYGDLLVHES